MSQIGTRSCFAPATNRRGRSGSNVRFRNRVETTKINNPALPINPQPLASKLNMGVEFYEKLKKNDILFVTTGTGSGKTVCIPSYCLQYVIDNFPEQSSLIGNVILTQPKRMLVSSSSETLKFVNGREMVGRSLINDPEGNDDDLQHSILKVVVNQSFINQIKNDPLLLGERQGFTRVSIVIVDESHERSVETDLLFSLLKVISIERRRRNTFFKVVFMSASMDLNRIDHFFKKDSLSTHTIEFAGLDSKYDIDIYHIKEENEPWLPFDRNSVIQGDMLIDPKEDWNKSLKNMDYACFMLLSKLVLEGTGSIIVFLASGMNISAIKKLMLPNPDVRDPFYGWDTIEVTGQASRDAVRDGGSIPLYPGGKKIQNIYLATDVAESSITIDGLTRVIDSGVRLSPKYDPETDSSILIYSYITQSSALQRKGRVGRVARGKVYRMYSKQRYLSMLKTSVIGFYSVNIDEAILSMITFRSIYKSIGIDIGSPYTFDYIDSPTIQDITFSMDRLTAVGLVNKDFESTPMVDEYKRLPQDNIQLNGILETLFKLYSTRTQNHVRNALKMIYYSFEQRDIVSLCSMVPYFGFGDNQASVNTLCNKLGDFGCVLALFTYPITETNRIQFTKGNLSDLHTYLHNIKGDIPSIQTDGRFIENIKPIIQNILCYHTSTMNKGVLNPTFIAGRSILFKESNQFQHNYVIEGKKMVGVNGYYDRSVNLRFKDSYFVRGRKTEIEIKIRKEGDFDPPPKLLYLKCHNHTLSWCMPVEEFKRLELTNIFRDSEE